MIVHALRAQDMLMHVDESDEGHMQSSPASWQERLRGLSGTFSTGENDEVEDERCKL